MIGLVNKVTHSLIVISLITTEESHVMNKLKLKNHLS